MLQHRVIPVLLLRDQGLVKTRQFARPQYVGDPVNAIRIFNEKEVDELIVLDTDASREGRGPDYDLIASFSSECFMPLCYGAGVRSVEEADRLFSLGVEKVSLQTAAFDDLELIARIAARAGSQSVVASFDVKTSLFGRYQLFCASRGETVDRDWLEYLEAAVQGGAGEVLLQSVAREGTMKGLDLKLIEQAAARCPVPLIASGGVGSLTDIRAGVDAGASAIAAGAFCVFHGPHQAVLITYPPYAELTRLLND